MSAPTLTSLVARSVELCRDLDPLDVVPADGGFFFAHDGRAIAGVGAAWTVTVPAGRDLVARAGHAVADALAAIATVGPRPPMVVGALPYDDTAPAILVVPRTAIVREPDGRVWQITTGDPNAPVAPDLVSDHVSDLVSGLVPDLVPTRAASTPPAGTLRTTAVPPAAAYLDAVRSARDRIAAGLLDKVVLARMLVVQSDEPFDRRVLLARLRSAEPAAYTFAAGGFVGASPELLLARAGRTLLSNPLAGTAARSKNPDADHHAAQALLASAKDRAEHAPVAAAVAAALAPVCAPFDIDESPSVIGTSTAWHLSTRARGILVGTENALCLAARLHPTPAVCGAPRDDARATIRELEQIDRRLYAGLVGWTDAAGDGEWAVVLRCAEVQGRLALLFAGAGIVADSDPEQELAETQLKFGPMLGALNG